MTELVERANYIKKQLYELGYLEWSASLSEIATALSSQATRDEVLDRALEIVRDKRNASSGSSKYWNEAIQEIRALKQQPWARKDGTTSPVRGEVVDRRATRNGCEFGTGQQHYRRLDATYFGRRSGDRARWGAQPEPSQPGLVEYNAWVVNHGALGWTAWTAKANDLARSGWEVFQVAEEGCSVTLFGRRLSGTGGK